MRLILFVAAAFAALSLAAASPELAPLPEAKVTILSEKGPADNLKSLISGPGAGLLRFARLEGSRVAVEFPEPVALPELAVIRYGYDDWAVPLEVEYRVNGGEAKRVKLSAPRVANHLGGKSPAADRLPLGDGPVSKIELTVVDVDTKSKQHCAHGILKLAVPKAQEAASPAPETGPVYTLRPLPKAAVTALAEIKEPERLVSLNLAEVTIGDVGGFAFRIAFEEPVLLPEIALIRVGWADWTLPKSIEIRVNGKAAQNFNLSAARVMPNAKGSSHPADILRLGDEPVKTLECKVTSTESRGNKHGSLKLAVPAGASITQPVAMDCSNTAGVEVEIELDSPADGVLLTAVNRRFRREDTWSRPLPPLVKGVNKLFIPWSEFGNSERPETTLVPANVHQLGLFFARPSGRAVFRFTPVPAAAGRDFWAGFDMPDFSAAADGWRSGIPADGFGRFGYQPNNGLLSFNLQNEGIFYQTTEGQHYGLTFGNGGAQKTQWSRVDVRSDYMVRTLLRRFVGVEENKVTSRAFGMFDVSRFPERWVSSILAPGILIYSHDAVFTVKPDNDLGAAHLLLPTAGGKLRWVKAGGADLGALAEGWALLFFEKRPGLPLLLAFDRKADRAVEDSGTVGFVFGQPRGWLGIGTPAGNRPWKGTIGQLDGETERIAAVSRRLAALLRNYPLQSDMKFKVADGRVEFAEGFRFLSWRNAWGEGGEVRLPCPPLVAFGAGSGYPVAFPEGEPEFFGLDTKYGPYRTWPLSRMARGRYSLPLPPEDNLLYPRPLHEPKAAEYAAAITKHIGGAPEALLKGDSLAGWWMRASGAMAQSLFSEAQEKEIAAGWKPRVEFVNSPRAWHVRREPFSGVRYPISFAWEDRANEILGDPNSGIGGALSGAANYARFTGDWETIGRNWEAIRRFPLFFYRSHDWAMMQSGCREHTAASAIDMDVITYEGAAALCRMAKTLGKEDDLAAGRMLLARYALSSCLKWKAPEWRGPGRPRGEWKGIGIGFSEHYGFEVMSARGKDQNYINSEIALSLAWIGDFPSFFDMLIEGNGKEFWRFFEYDYVEKQLDRWRHRHAGKRNWHDANIAPHLYLRLLLGEPIGGVTRELEEQKMLSPDPRMAAENAGFYALYLAWDSPVQLLDWGKARLLRFDWDKSAKSVVAEFDSPEPFRLTLRLAGIPVEGPTKAQEFPAGKHRVSWRWQK